MKLLLLLLLITTTAKAQSNGFEHVEPGDRIMMAHDTLHTWSGHTMNDSVGVEIEVEWGGVWYKYNYRPVPMGYYCDTTINAIDGNSKSDLRYICVTIFMDRKLIVSIRTIAKYKWAWSVDIDESFFRKASK